MIGINLTGRGSAPLQVIKRDPLAPQEGYSARSYCSVLDSGLLPYYDGESFQQDNAPVHTASFTTAWFHVNGVLLAVKWPAFSPDLNPIEHLWPHLKAKLYELFPDLDSITDKDEQVRVLEELLPRAWNAIDLEIIISCIKSMPDRIAAVIQAHGWQTRY